MNKDELTRVYLDAFFGIARNPFTMNLAELEDFKSRLSRSSFSSADNTDMKEELLVLISLLVKARSCPHLTKYERAREILKLAARNKLNAPTMSFALGAGLSIDWDLEKLFAEAEKNRFHYDIALREAALYLKATHDDPNKEIPKVVLLFVSKILEGSIQRPKARGPHQLMYFGRDSAVVEMVKLSIENGLRPYRNEASEEAQSACDLVAEICAQTQMGVRTYEAVRKIWQNRHRSREEFNLYVHPCTATE